MAEKTGIGWTDHTLNLWWGCTEVAPGCKNCYARELSKRFSPRTIWGPKEPRLFIKGAVNSLQRWQKAAAKEGGKRRVFLGSMMDIFERPRPLIDRNGKMLMNMMTGDLRRALFAAITDGVYPNIEFQMLTKRPQNISKCLPVSWYKTSAPPNVLIGTSIAIQDDVDIHLNALRDCTPMNIRKFLSIEPLVGRVDLFNRLEDIDWVIVGGESGPHARPMHPWWATEIVEQCHDEKIPVFMKQTGAWRICDEEDDVQEKDVAVHFSGSSVDYLGWADMIVKDSQGMWKRMRRTNGHGTDLEDIPEHWRLQQFP